MSRLMSEAEALARIKLLVERGAWRVDRKHGWPRALQRRVNRDDIKQGLLTGYLCQWQIEHERWRVDGYDLENEDLAIAVAEDLVMEVLVVTVF